MKIPLSKLLGSCVVTSDYAVGSVLDWRYQLSTWQVSDLVCRFSSDDQTWERLVPVEWILPRVWDLPRIELTKDLAALQSCPAAPTTPTSWLPWVDGSSGFLPVVPVVWDSEEGGDGRPSRSFRGCRYFDVYSAQGYIGECQEFYVDEATWKIERLAVLSGRFWRRSVLLPPVAWINSAEDRKRRFWSNIHPSDWALAPTMDSPDRLPEVGNLQGGFPRSFGQT